MSADFVDGLMVAVVSILVLLMVFAFGAKAERLAHPNGHATSTNVVIHLVN